MARVRERLPMAFHSFGMFCANDMLHKAQREYFRLVDAKSPDDRRDAAINCALTLWHLTDWFWCAVEPRDTDEGLRQYFNIVEGKITKSAFVREVVHRCPELELCQAIANGSKHVQFGKKIKTLESILNGYETAPQVGDDPLYVWSRGTQIEAAEIFQTVLSYWIRMVGPGEVMY